MPICMLTLPRILRVYPKMVNTSNTRTRANTTAGLAAVVAVSGAYANYPSQRRIIDSASYVTSSGTGLIVSVKSSKIVVRI